ncbi:BRO-N domain-containing protein [Photorhabdus thracensis]|uniref:hypothetical protein n=1 Tax=Photorhabdus thracensis TaxID=230089 RepID=UPI001E5779D7|nr:hypothetical protein [Photorhabdus thracensis]MCC8421458.1 hypothetical protein [Photorhabdus thracensis]
MNTLTFNNHTIVPFDNGDGKIWFTGKQMTKLLEYEDDKSVNKLYKRNKDEFSEDMTTTVNLPIDAEEANLTPTGKSKGYRNLRKRHLKKLRKAKQTILELSQLTLPGFDDFPDGEPA